MDEKNHSGMDVTIVGYDSLWADDCGDLLDSLNASDFLAGRDYMLLDGGDGVQDGGKFPRLVVNPDNSMGLVPCEIRGLGEVLASLHQNSLEEGMQV